MTARCDVAIKSADSVNAKSDLSEEEIEAKSKVGTDCRAPSLNDRNFSERAFTVDIILCVFWELVVTVFVLYFRNFEFGVGLQMGTGNWGRYSLLQIVALLLSKAVKVFTEELVPANPDILEGVADLIQLSYLN
ncbi:unnamed protein product [Brassica oleracea]